MAPKTRRFAGCALLAASALLGWLVLRPSAKVPEPEPTPSTGTQLDAPQASAVVARQAELVLASNAVPNLPAAPESPPAALPHPHPITPQHERIYRAAFGDPASSRDLPPEEEPDWDRINAAALEYKVEAIGPPPESRAEG